MERLVDGVEHVYIPMTQASAAFAVLTEQLQLPVLWPYTFFGAFFSGGVSVGSIKLEIIEANPTAPWYTPPQVTGIAFRPARPLDDGYIAELDVRGIPHSDPEHFQRGEQPAWTNVYFSDFISPAAGAFVCD